MPKKSQPIKSPASTATGRLNVLLERVEEQQRVVIEAVVSNREALERRIDQLDGRLSSRIDVLEIAVRQNSTDIRQNTADIRQISADLKQNSADIKQNSADIKQASADIRAVDAKLDTKADAARLAALEDRVGSLTNRPS